jgi:hypothetical protein
VELVPDIVYCPTNLAEKAIWPHVHAIKVHLTESPNKIKALLGNNSDSLAVGGYQELC